MVLRRRYLWLLLVVVAVAAPWIHVTSARRPWQSGGLLALGGELAVAPWVVLEEQVRAWWARGRGAVAAWQDQHRELAALREQVRELRLQMLDYAHMSSERGRLQRALELVEAGQMPRCLAQVIQTSYDGPYHSVRLRSSASQRPEMGNFVVTEAGLVGRVLRAGGLHTVVQLVTDVHFAVDVLVERNRVAAIFVGDGQRGGMLRLFRDADLKLGDRVVTSQRVSGVPPGIPVAVVTRISYSALEVVPRVSVEPMIDADALSEVFVYRQSGSSIADLVDDVDALSRKVAGAKEWG